MPKLPEFGSGTGRRRNQPEISWTYTPRIEPGQYTAYSRSATVYRDRQFKRWVCAVQFDVLDSSFLEVMARLTWFLNLGSKEKPRATRRSNYWAAWVKAKGGPPKRRDRISERVFEGRYAIVRVEDTGKNHRQIAITSDECYSVIRDVVEWQTGGAPRNHASL
jgi:hypothetical protein